MKYGCLISTRIDAKDVENSIGNYLKIYLHAQTLQRFQNKYLRIIVNVTNDFLHQITEYYAK